MNFWIFLISQISIDFLKQIPCTPCTNNAHSVEILKGMGIADAACKYFIEIPNQIKVASSLQIQ